MGSERSGEPDAEPYTEPQIDRSPLESISAVTLLTTDMARATAFYEALGFPRLYGGPDAAFTSYRVGPGYLNLELDAGGRPLGRIWGRVIVWVDDVDAMFGRAKRAGYRAETEPADASWGERYFHIRDPDGNELSLARPLQPGVASPDS